MLEPIVKRCAGLDVHRRNVVATILVELPDGTLQEETREFRTFRQGRKELAQWLKDERIELALMESTGIYFKPVYAQLESAGLKVQVVNARYVKNVPGRKTDVKDSQWLSQLGRFGLLKPSFIPVQDLRELRLISRYHQKLKKNLSQQKNRLHKILDDAGIHLGCVVSDIHGVSARAMIAGLIAGEDIDTLLGYAKGQLKSKKVELQASLDGELSHSHRFMLQHIGQNIQHLESEIAQLEQELLDRMQPYHRQWQLLQTLPGVDQIGAALLIAEMGVDMTPFQSIKRFTSWAGMCPSNNESAGKKKAVPNTREIPHYAPSYAK